MSYDQAVSANGSATDRWAACTDQGDVYSVTMQNGYAQIISVEYAGNLGTGPVAAPPESIGDIKGKF